MEIHVNKEDNKCFIVVSKCKVGDLCLGLEKLGAILLSKSYWALFLFQIQRLMEVCVCRRERKRERDAEEIV